MKVPIIHARETGSTNADAMVRAQAGEPLPFWLSAETQSAGKGRSGRAWVSGPGNLHASLALQLSCAPAIASQLSLVAGVAVIDAIISAGNQAGISPAPQFRLKWPNDIVCGSAKFGGILVETSAGQAAGGLIAVIGVGVNVLSHPVIEGRKTSSLAACGLAISRDALLYALEGAMDSGLRLWNEGAGFDGVRQRWLMAGLAVGTQLTVNTGTAVAQGRFAGLDADGALLLTDLSGRRQRFTFGDVTLTGEL